MYSEDDLVLISDFSISFIARDSLHWPTWKIYGRRTGSRGGEGAPREGGREGHESRRSSGRSSGWRVRSLE
jgi:hypothetical protein